MSELKTHADVRTLSTPRKLATGVAGLDMILHGGLPASRLYLLVIDSLNGYVAAMPQEQYVALQLHELLSYLNQRGVTTFLINPQSGLVGSMATSSINISHVADAVILIRFFEAEGRIRKALSIIKNRGGPHEDAIRELRIDHRSLRIGEPLTEFHGVMTGNPQYVGSSTPLMEASDSGA